MGKKKNKGNGYGEGTWVETKMFLSKAFINLGKSGTSPEVSYASKAMLLMLMGKRQFKYLPDKKGGNKIRKRTDDNKFTLTYSELKSHDISKNPATRGFDELLAKGFISIKDPGGMFEKHKAVYSLEEDYLNWTPEEKQVFRTRQRDVSRGYQKSKRKNIAYECVPHPHPLVRATPPMEDTHSCVSHPQKSESDKEKCKITW